jgi:hypothetical protein
MMNERREPPPITFRDYIIATVMFVVVVLFLCIINS